MLSTPRLALYPATPDLLRDLLRDAGALTEHLGARVPGSWPPEHVDADTLRYVLDRVVEDPSQADWWLYFVVGTEGAAEGIVLGTAGYKGAPGSDGTVEVGYSIVSEHRRRGFATEAVERLLDRAFRVEGVRRAIAETLPELAPSIGVLRKLGFEPEGEGSEPGVIRYTLARESYLARRNEDA